MTRIKRIGDGPACPPCAVAAAAGFESVAVAQFAHRGGRLLQWRLAQTSLKLQATALKIA